MRGLAAYVACAAAMIFVSSGTSANIIGAVSVYPATTILVGDRAEITLGVSGWTFDSHFYYQGFYWEAAPWVTDVSFYDGLGGSVHLPSSSVAGTPTTHWTAQVTYAGAGTFSPHFEALIIDRLTRPGDCGSVGQQHFLFCLTFADLGGDFSTSITVNSQVAVPGPIIGAGLPGLLLAAFSLLFIFPRRSRPCH